MSPAEYCITHRRVVSTSALGIIVGASIVLFLLSGCSGDVAGLSVVGDEGASSVFEDSSGTRESGEYGIDGLQTGDLWLPADVEDPADVEEPADVEKPADVEEPDDVEKPADDMVQQLDCEDAGCNGDNDSSSCSSDCGDSSQPPPDPSKELAGYVDGVTKVDGVYNVRGWACQLAWDGSIGISVYVGGEQGVGTFLKDHMANLSNEPAVNAACEVGGGDHRYQVPLTAEEISAHGGEAIFVYGVSPSGGVPKLLINSGEFFLPMPAATGESCNGCLAGTDSCSVACQGLGFSDGFCKFPGSTDPGSCCECFSDVTCPSAVVPPPIASDFSNVVWIHDNISSWPQTVSLEATKGPQDMIHITNNGTNCGPGNACWPNFNPTYVPPSSNLYNQFVGGVWIFVYQDGVWVAGLFDSIVRNQQVVWDHNLHPGSGWPGGLLDNFKPQSCERYGWMISTALPVISTQFTTNERSNVSEFVWP